MFIKTIIFDRQKSKKFRNTSTIMTTTVKKKCIYIDAVNEQRTVEKSLYSMRAQKSTPVPQPLEDWAGVSVDGTVQNGGASLDDSLRHVSFSLQHRRLCRDKHH